MKQIMLVALTAVTLYGYQSQADSSHVVAERNYTWILTESKIETVVESALYCIVELKINYPECELPELCHYVSRLSSHGETPQIRYKASIASLYLENHSLTVRILPGNYDDSPEFWKMLVDNIENKEISKPHI